MVSSHVAEGRKLLARRACSGAKCEPSISFPYLIGAGNAGEKQAKLAARMAIWMLVRFFCFLLSYGCVVFLFVYLVQGLGP